MKGTLLHILRNELGDAPNPLQTKNLDIMTTQHTQGEWINKGPGRQFTNRREIATLDSDQTIMIIEGYGDKTQDEANAALICDAVNNTAGKGINPNAVPELLKVLSIISQHAYDDDTPKEDILADFDNMRGLAINAIKAAELKQ